MQRTQFTFYASYYNAVKQLNRKDQSAVLMAICSYALEEQEPSLTGTARAIFELIKPTLDASRKKAAAGQARRQNKEEAKAKQSESKMETEREQNESKTETETEQTANENKKEKEYKKEYEIEIENECLKEKLIKRKSPDGLTRSRFKKPTVAEVVAYCKERNNGIDGEMFVDYYEANGWHVGKQPMKDWKAAVRTWERRGKADGSTAKNHGEPENAARDWGISYDIGGAES